MNGKSVRLPSPAMAVSVAALFVALGGTSYAAFSLPNNSVGTKQLKNGAVTGSKIKNRRLSRPARSTRRASPFPPQPTPSTQPAPRRLNRRSQQARRLPLATTRSAWSTSMSRCPQPVRPRPNCSSSMV